MDRRTEAELKNLKERVKRIEDELQLSPTVTSFDWKQFNDRDKSILMVLLKKEREGATTTEIAEILEMEPVETSGRVKVYRSLRRIERLSRKLKGFPIVVYEKRKWSLNYQDWQFHIKIDSKDQVDQL